MPLFGKQSKNPVDLVKSLKESLVALEKSDKGSKSSEKSLEDISKNLNQIKTLIAAGQESEHSDVVGTLSTNMIENGLIVMMIQHLSQLDFEGRKDVVTIFCTVVRWQVGGRFPTVEYLEKHPEIFKQLIHGYEQADLAQTCGPMLRECAKQELLTSVILNLDEFYLLFDFIDSSSFEVSSDSIETFKELLTKMNNKNIVAAWLTANYDKFFGHYNKLLQTENYVSKRQALKLLGEILLDRHNFSVMQLFIANPDNLKSMMKLLKDKSKNIQFEAFHVFKIFVANPQKPQPIMDILSRNRDKLVSFLTNFQADKTQDEQFMDEKVYLIKQLKEIPVPSSSGAGGSSTPTIEPAQGSA